MLSFPNCKINLGLHILHKREDGFHDIETIFYPVPLMDALEFIQIPGTVNRETEFTCTGLKINGDESENLCIKAYRAVKKDHPQLPALKIHLHKTIPMGAGLGGGSADAAFFLKSLNEYFNLSLSPAQLSAYALELGSDCPFFLINKPCFARGRGELLEEINIDLSAYRILLVNPGIHVDTGRAFSQITPSLPEENIKGIIQQPVETWKTKLVNDFEDIVFLLHPELKDIKTSLYQQGAVYASMSGSGSTVYGIFANDPPNSLFTGKDYLIKIIK